MELSPHARALGYRLDARAVTGSTNDDAGAARVLRLALERARASEAEHVGWRIREYVWRASMTQAEFARAVGTSPSRMSTYLSGSVTPSAVMLERMRRVAEETSGS